jgi:RimJ/RimL family protein N-acetyltransferase
MGGCSLYEVHAIDNFGAIAYWVRTGQTKNGTATRAARLVARFGLHELGLNRVELVIAVNNHASLRVADKLGATREGILRQRLVIGDQACDAVMFSLLLEDV